MPTFDEIRTAVAKCDALAHAAETMFDETAFGADIDSQRLERLAHLIGATAESAAAAVVMIDRLNAEALNPAIPADAEAVEREGSR